MYRLCFRPIVPFLYRDDLIMDDIPNIEKEIAQGFERGNAYFIGNTALSRLILDEAELCVEDTAADIQVCRPIEKAMLSTAGSTHKFQDLDESAVNNLHKMIAILSGQLAPTILESNLLISWGDTAQAFVSTNPKLCASNQSTAWGSPVHCFTPCVRPFTCGVTPVYKDYQGYTRVSDLIQHSLTTQGAWGFHLYGVQLNPRDIKQELIFGGEPDAFVTSNGAKTPWNVVYVRAKGTQVEDATRITTNRTNALRCTPKPLCDTNADPIVCIDDKTISKVPNITNREARKVDMHSNALTTVAKTDFVGMSKMKELDLDQNVITSIEEQVTEPSPTLPIIMRWFIIQIA